MYSKENLSSAIRSYRKVNNMTQEDFAIKAGISLRALSKVESKAKKDQTIQIDIIEKALIAAECELVIVKSF